MRPLEKSIERDSPPSFELHSAAPPSSSFHFIKHHTKRLQSLSHPMIPTIIHPSKLPFQGLFSYPTVLFPGQLGIMLGPQRVRVFYVRFSHLRGPVSSYEDHWSERRVSKGYGPSGKVIRYDKERTIFAFYVRRTYPQIISSYTGPTVRTTSVYAIRLYIRYIRPIGPRGGCEGEHGAAAPVPLINDSWIPPQ